MLQLRKMVKLQKTQNKYLYVPILFIKQNLIYLPTLHFFPTAEKLLFPTCCPNTVHFPSHGIWVFYLYFSLIVFFCFVLLMLWFVSGWCFYFSTTSIEPIFSLGCVLSCCCFLTKRLVCFFAQPHEAYFGAHRGQQSQVNTFNSLKKTG